MYAWCDLERVLKSTHVSLAHDGRVDVALEERKSNFEHLSCEHNHGGSTIANLLVLSAGELNHGLGGWVSHVDLW